MFDFNSQEAHKSYVRKMVPEQYNGWLPASAAPCNIQLQLRISFPVRSSRCYQLSIFSSFDSSREAGDASLNRVKSSYINNKSFRGRAAAVPSYRIYTPWEWGRGGGGYAIPIGISRLRRELNIDRDDGCIDALYK